MHLASYARLAASDDRFVVKSYSQGSKWRARLAEQMRCQALCKAMALEFIALALPDNADDAGEGDHRPIDFAVVACLEQFSDGPGDDVECLSLEPLVEDGSDGAYGEKVVWHNNHLGCVNDEMSEDPLSQTAQAFSHFSFERSRGRFLVCNLQGVGSIFTDPVVHTSDRGRFPLCNDNLGADGFKMFFAYHKRNDICLALGLKTDKWMIASGELDFRDSWPPLETTGRGTCRHRPQWDMARPRWDTARPGRCAHRW